MRTEYGPSSIVTDGLIFYLDAANLKSYPSTGSTCFDLTENNYDATIYQATHSDNYFNFDGVDDNIYISNMSSNAPKIQSLNNQLSISVGFYPNSVSEDNTGSLIRSGISSVDVAFSVISGNTFGVGKVSLLWWDGGEFQSVSSTDNSIILDKWNIATINRDGSSVTFYINGEHNLLHVGLSLSNPVPTPTDLGIGATRAGTTVGSSIDDFSGRISFVQIYDRPLTESEIKQNFEALRWRFGI